MPRKQAMFDLKEFFSHYSDTPPGNKSNIIQSTNIRELFRSKSSQRRAYSNFVGPMFRSVG